jgi:hypothetical protein
MLRKLGRDLVTMAVFAGIMTALFLLGDLIVYGRVNW